jgi:glyoxylase-like metal-dependent hydrolase (beta-lactamase superfamily II)
LNRNKLKAVYMKRIIVFSILIMIITVAASFEMRDTFTYTFGDSKIYLLSEGQQTGSVDILVGATAKMTEEAVPEGAFPNAVNAFLVQKDGKNILVDAGFGRKLFDNLASFGVTPEKIDIILLTHLHGDHIGGLVKDGNKTFVNADLYIAKPEYDYWMAESADLPENMRNRFTNVQNIINKYEGLIKLFEPVEPGSDKEVLPSIKAFAAYGHTPGHTVYEIDGGNEKLLIWGDLTHAMAIQMPYPQVAVSYDVNPQDAVDARDKILKYVVKNKIPVAGMHIAYPGMGKVEKKGDGYKFIPLQ